MVSRLLGKLEVRRHLISGALCAMAGAAMVVAAAAAPRPAVAIKSRLFMVSESSLDDGARTPGAVPLAQRLFLWGGRQLSRLENQACLANLSVPIKTRRIQPAAGAPYRT